MGFEERRALQVLLEMQERLSRDPYDALGLIPSATAADIRNAFLTMTKQFHPARFGRMSPDIQKLANEVFLALRAAHDAFARPSTIAKQAPLRPSGVLPTMRPAGTGATPLVRPSPTNGPPVASHARPGSNPLPGGARPTGAPPILVRPATGQTPTIRPGTTPGPARPAPSTSSSQAVTQQIRTNDHAVTQPMRTDRTPAPQLVRPGSVGARPPTGPGAPLARPPTAQPAAGARPGAPVDRELAPILELIAQQQLAAARVALETLVARAPQSTKYRALLAYAKGREAQLERRIDEARVELQDALQLDPDLQLAKTALAELFTRRR